MPHSAHMTRLLVCLLFVACSGAPTAAVELSPEPVLSAAGAPGDTFPVATGDAGAPVVVTAANPTEPVGAPIEPEPMAGVGGSPAVDEPGAGAAGETLTAGAAGASTEPAPWPPVCVPNKPAAACKAAAYHCGTLPDGCGGEVTCGECPTFEVCTYGTCRPTCASMGFHCGRYVDLGIDCGSCPGGAVCGPQGVCP